MATGRLRRQAPQERRGPRADAFEHRIIAELAKTPTESGMAVELSWEIADDEPDLRSTIKVLRTDANLLGADQREALRTFFMRRTSDLRSLEPRRRIDQALYAVVMEAT